MAKLGPEAATAGKQIASQLSKEIKSAEATAKKYGAAAATAAKNTSDLGTAASRAAKAAGPLGGILARLSPEAGAVASSFAAGTSALEGFGVAGVAGGVAMLGIAEAVAIGYVAWRAYTEDGTRAKEITTAQSAAFAALGPILDSTRMATIDLQIATGELSEAQGALEKNSIRAFEALNKATEASRKNIAALTKQQSSYLTQMVDMIPDVVSEWTPLGLVIDGVTESSAELQERIDGEQESIDAATEAVRKNVEVTAAAIVAKDKHTKAARATAEAERELADALKEEEERFARRLKAAEDALEFDEKAAKDRAKIAEKEAEDAEEREQVAAERKLEIDRATQAASSAILASGADFAMSVSNAMGEEHQEEARTAFAVAQAVGIAQAAINAGIASSRAYADYPYPASLAVSAAAGLSAGAAIVSIAATPAPSFEDTPGVMEMESGGTVKFAAGDKFAAAKSSEDLQRQTGGGGRASGGSGFNQVNHRSFDYWMRDHLKTRGALPTKIRGNERVGHGP